MTESNSQPEKPKDQPRFSQEQYDMLKRCSDRKDMTEWNEWRKSNPDEDILLEEADLSGRFLNGAFLGTEITMGFMGRLHLGLANLSMAQCHRANFYMGDLRGANLQNANLEGSILAESSLQGAKLCNADLSGASLWHAHLEGTECYGSHMSFTDLEGAHLEKADLRGTDLEQANLYKAHLPHVKLNNANLKAVNMCRVNLKGADLNYADLTGTSFLLVVVDGATSLWGCKIDRKTDFRGVGLESCRIDVMTKHLLEYNIRRMNWEEWYKQHKVSKWPVWLFWLMSNYGISTGRIVAVFLGFALAFAAVYYICGLIAPPGIIDYLFEDANGGQVGWGLALVRAIHFSVVIMTVGFTNMHANAHSFWAHVLVGFQMILGFVLLGALVTRFAVLFTAGGPAGKFADEKTIWQWSKELHNKMIEKVKSRLDILMKLMKERWSEFEKKP